MLPGRTRRGVAAARGGTRDNPEDSGAGKGGKETKERQRCDPGHCGEGGGTQSPSLTQQGLTASTGLRAGVAFASGNHPPGFTPSSGGGKAKTPGIAHPSIVPWAGRSMGEGGLLSVDKHPSPSNPKPMSTVTPALFHSRSMKLGETPSPLEGLSKALSPQSTPRGSQVRVRSGVNQQPHFPAPGDKY